MYFDVDGIRTFAYTGSRTPVPGQPAITFIHGGGCDHTVWNLQSRYLAHHGYNVYGLDLPAHGLSSGDPLHSVEDMAQWVWRAMDSLGEPRTAFIGHSMGSLVALEAAGHRPDATWMLCLVGTALPMGVTDELLGAAEQNSHDAFDMVNLWGHAVSSQIGGSQAPGMWMTGGTVRLLERSRPGVLHRDLAACNNYVDGLKAAARVSAPCRLVLGSADIMSPPKLTAELTATLADVTVTTLQGSGHMLMGERPNELLDAILSGVSASQAA